MNRISTSVFSARLWLLWLRHSYRFRWAHRPLCPRFDAGVLRIGNLHLCRSCACAYGGVLCGLSLLFFDTTRVGIVPLLLGLMILTIGLSLPSLYQRLSRPVRDVIRFSMGLCIALCAGALLTGNVLVSVACGCTLALFWRAYFVMRRRRRAEACEACPELGQGDICTGCRVQADAIRAYEVEATQLLMNRGETYRPYTPRSAAPRD